MLCSNDRSVDGCSDSDAKAVPYQEYVAGFTVSCKIIGRLGLGLHAIFCKSSKIHFFRNSLPSEGTAPYQLISKEKTGDVII